MNFVADNNLYPCTNYTVTIIAHGNVTHWFETSKEKILSLGGHFCYDKRFINSIANDIPCAIVSDPESNTVIYCLTKINF